MATKGIKVFKNGKVTINGHLAGHVREYGNEWKATDPEINPPGLFDSKEAAVEWLETSGSHLKYKW